MSKPSPIPSASSPLLNGASPVALSSPVNIADFNDKDEYGEFYNAVLAMLPDNEYRTGVRIGYEMLTGGASPDFGIGCFAVRTLAARKAGNHPVNAGVGAEDVWRLLMENGMDVAAVVARVGS